MGRLCKPDILSGLRYHGHSVLIAHVDSERFFTRDNQGDPVSPFVEPLRIFNEKAVEVRRFLEKVWTGSKGGMQGGETQFTPEFADFLYNPLSFVALGDSDCITITAVDEFEPAAQLSSLTDVPIRQTCFAFCPELKQLGLKAERYKDIFCEFDDIFSDPYIGMKRGTDPKALASCEGFMKHRPLLGVTYFKLNGMAVLGPGLMMQEYALKVMADRIRTTLNELRKKVGELSDILPNGEQDINSFRCMLLDPQGWSDVATLMFATNYSVIATVVIALRSLTMADLYGKSDEDGGANLKDAVKCFDLHRLVAQRAGEGKEPLLDSNHIFCSSYTTAGIYQRAFERRDVLPDEPFETDYHYSGTVIGDTNVSVCAGHVKDLKDRAEHDHKTLCRQNGQSESLDAKYIWYILGHNDYVYQQLADAKRDVGNAVLLSHLIKEIKAVRTNAGTTHRNGTPFAGTHVLDVCTKLRVPVPQIGGVMQGMNYDSHVEVRSVLESLRRSVFETPKGHLSIERLADALRILRVPSPLSSAIVFVYTDFADYLSDPFLFDSVLDLYDIFVAIHTLLVEELPARLKMRLADVLKVAVGEKQAKSLEGELFSESQDEMQAVLCGNEAVRERLDSICLGFLNADDLEDLVEIVKLLQNAMANRVQITFNAARRWNVTVDARGVGLDRIISAADAPLKCGLGMLRRLMNHLDEKKHADGSHEEIDAGNRRRIGGASEISYRPRCFSRRLVVGDAPQIFINSVDLNLSHLTRPRAFCVHLHETAHLVSNLLRERQGCTHQEFACAMQDKCCHKKQSFAKDPLNAIYLERYEEIFAEMLVLRFVFVDDPKLHLRSYVANYSLDPISLADHENRTLIRMVEVLVRGFLASDPLRAKDLYAFEGEQAPKLEAGALDETFDRFCAAIEDAGPFLHSFRHYWHGDKSSDVKAYVREEFTRIYKAAHHPLCCMWSDVTRIHKIVTEHTYPAGADTVKSLVDQICHGVEEGRPIVRVKYGGNLGDASQPEEARLDSLFLVSNLLRKHIETLYADIDTENAVVYLPRRTNGLPDPDAVQPGQKWNCRLLDRGFNGLVVPDPEKRKQSMRSRIAILKTLWDISTTLRARRMKQMLAEESSGAVG